MGEPTEKEAMEAFKASLRPYYDVVGPMNWDDFVTHWTTLISEPKMKAYSSWTGEKLDELLEAAEDEGFLLREIGVIDDNMNLVTLLDDAGEILPYKATKKEQ